MRLSNCSCYCSLKSHIVLVVLSDQLTSIALTVVGFGHLCDTPSSRSTPEAKTRNRILFTISQTSFVPDGDHQRPDRAMHVFYSHLINKGCVSLPFWYAAVSAFVDFHSVSAFMNSRMVAASIVNNAQTLQTCNRLRYI